MRKVIFLVVVMLILATTLAFAEEIKLSTIVPDQQLVRGKDGAIGTSYQSKTDADVPDGNLIVEGNVGIGTTNPGANLEINGPASGAIKIVDGNQAAGKVLTSNANGVGTWQTGGKWVSKWIQVYNGKSNALWNDLDLSTVPGLDLGKRRSLVMLKVAATTNTSIMLRTKGDDIDNVLPYGCNAGTNAFYAIVETNDNGIMQWTASKANYDLSISVIGYISS